MWEESFSKRKMWLHTIHWESGVVFNSCRSLCVKCLSDRFLRGNHRMILIKRRWLPSVSFLRIASMFQRHQDSFISTETPWFTVWTKSKNVRDWICECLRTPSHLKSHWWLWSTWSTWKQLIINFLYCEGSGSCLHSCGFKIDEIWRNLWFD